MVEFNCNCKDDQGTASLMHL